MQSGVRELARRALLEAAHEARLDAQRLKILMFILQRGFASAVGAYGNWAKPDPSRNQIQPALALL
jgi:hypothetical protein